MKTRKPTPARGGARTKAPGGLPRVLYLRVDQPLLDKIEELRAARSKQIGSVLSTADFVRWLLTHKL